MLLTWNQYERGSLLGIPDKLIFFGLICLIAFTPLAFGTTEPWSITLMQLSVAAMTGLFFVSRILTGRLDIPNPKLILLFAVFVLFVMVQTLPLPYNSGDRVIRLISGSVAPWPFPFKPETLSVYPYATRQAWLVLLSYLGSFLLITCYFSQLGTTLNARGIFGLTAMVRFMIFFSFALSLFAIMQHFALDQALYSFPGGSAPFGPFVNRNHYAGYMELTIPLVLTTLFVKNLKPEMLVLYGVMAMVMTASLFLSLSRSGIGSFIGQLVFLSLLLRLPKGIRGFHHRRLFLPLALILIVVSLTWLSFEPVIQRFINAADADAGAPGRIEVWKDTLRIARAFLLTGTGLGTFSYIYPLYQNVAGKWEAVHNDYVQLLAETGLIGLSLALLFISLALAKAVALIRAEYSHRMLAVRAGALTGCFGILLHSFTDFNLQIPSNALLFCILLAMATVTVSPKPAGPLEVLPHASDRPGKERECATDEDIAS